MVLVTTVIVACGRASDPAPDSETTATASASSTFIPTQAQVDRFLSEGPDPTLRKIAVADYWLHYKLMQATGIEKELGGEAQAIESLKAVGEAYERRMRIAEVELPKMIPATFTGEGMDSGFMGLGLGSFLGLITGGMTSGTVSQMSDQQLAELSKAGPIKQAGETASLEMQFAEDGSLSQSMEFEVNEKGLNGKVRLKSKMDACPDADGRVTVEIDIDSQMSVSGKPGTGGRVQSKFKYERYLDDDAHLIDTGDGSASKLQVKMGGYENFESQSVDVTTGHERGGKTTFQEHNEHGFNIFQIDEVERTLKLLEATELLQTLMAEVMLRGMGSGTSPWESGRCIDLKVTSSPAKRTGLKPSTTFDLDARPRTKSDGSPARGTVTATLTGGSQVQPADSKVPADAKYAYTGPEKKEESASIAFEARSKRGVGKATLAFDTKVARAYRMEGGAGEFHGTGVVCNLEEQFFVEGSGVTVRFEPSSGSAGRYSYSGSNSGFALYGHGTYVVNTDGEVATGIVAKGPGSVKSPMGVHTAQGTENYKLTPLDSCPAGS
jgi:hypothetical protein